MSSSTPPLDFKRRLFPKGVRRTLEDWRRRLFQRVTRERLTETLREFEIPSGSWICIHAQLSGLGYLEGGPGIVIDAVLDAVPRCTILMPSFPFSGACHDHLQSNPLYDPKNTPSASGLLSETLRLYPGARRSLHPTHPCVALGPDAAALIAGSEHSVTPFGPESAYGRYASSPRAWQLLLHTNATSIVHEFQEIVRMPNLFLPDLRIARGLDAAGQEQRYEVKVHTPLLPLFVATPEYVWFPDYALPFPAHKSDHLLARMNHSATALEIVERHEELRREGVFREGWIRDAEILAVHVPPWRARICEDVRQSFRRFPERYELEALREARRRGELIAT